MSVQKGLRTIRIILVKLAERPDCVEVCSYEGSQLIDVWIPILDRAIKRYESEAIRTRKYYGNIMSAGERLGR